DAYDKDFDTPRKSKEPLEEIDYLGSSQTPFSAKQRARLKETIGMVLLKAERNARLKAQVLRPGALTTKPPAACLLEQRLNRADHTTIDTLAAVPASTIHSQTTPTPLSSIEAVPITIVASPAATLPTTTTTQSIPKATRPSEFAPPPERITYDILTPTISSLPFKSTKLKQRVTTFGHHPACDYVWFDGHDSRVPRFAFDITFWRPRLERSLSKHPALKWQNQKDLYIIIATRTNLAILVNKVALTKKPDAEQGLRYGILRTGMLRCYLITRRREGKARSWSLKFIPGWERVRR
ncbi:MAG: hypothetical protein L6R42_004535, partial [Xanthoria sp. 1 TBL-2021]